MSTKKAPRPARDDIDRAVARIRKATGELVRLMGNAGAESPVDPRAMRALIDLGHYAVEPLAAGLRGARTPQHRCAIVLLISKLAAASTPEVIGVLRRIAEKDPDQVLRGMALDAISSMAARDMGARGQAERRRAAEVVAAAPEPKPPPDGCTAATARLFREGWLTV
jgi:hypothetical protein